MGVVTINLPRIAYLSENEEEFYSRLDHLMDLAARSLKIKRTVISQLLEIGLYPYTKRYLGTFNNHFSTIGLIGMNEAGRNAKWLRADMTDLRVQKFAQEVLTHMRIVCLIIRKEYGDLDNLEATPAESTTYRLAKHDVEQFPDIITASEPGGTPYYTNSSHLPVGFTDDIFEALDIQNHLQTLYTSGTVFHAFLGEKLPDWKAASNLVRKIAENYKLPYYTLSPTYSICRHHGYLRGEQYTCPICKEKAEVYSRITGYYRPVQNWNDGKLQEFKERQEYNIGTSRLTHKGPAQNPVTILYHPKTDACSVPQSSSSSADNGSILNAAKSLGKQQQESQIYLFTTKTCPNCRIADSLLKKAAIPYSKIDAEENMELTAAYDIRQAPTLVIVKGDHVEKFSSAPAIKKYLERQ